jgi:hypothetical protein
MNRKPILSKTALNELFGVSGYLARVTDQEAMDKGLPPVHGDPEAAKQGKNPYLKSTGGVRYPTGTRSKLFGSAKFIRDLQKKRLRQLQTGTEVLKATGVGPMLDQRIKEAERFRKTAAKSVGTVIGFTDTLQT